jgi:hypothetical protein
MLQENSPAMPDLRIVPLQLLVPHEEHDAQRSGPLLERIRKAGTWLNPPIVAPMSDGRYVILDGANRYHCVRELGYPYILVQAVDYESDAVQLDTWHHVVSHISWFELLRRLRELPGVVVEAAELLNARALLAQRKALAYVTLNDGKAYTLASNAETLAERNTTLRQIVDTYKSRSVLNRINTDSLRTAREQYPNAVGIFVFPSYQPVEIMVAARDHAYLPPGITRHVIHGRAMRLHYPLAAFEEDGLSLEQKNADLKHWIQERSAHKRIRYYAESSFLFDE